MVATDGADKEGNEDDKMKRPQWILLPALLLTLLLIGAYWLLPITSLPETVHLGTVGILVAVSFLMFLVLLLVFNAFLKKQRIRMDTIFAENAGTAAHVVREVPVPCLLADATGSVVWRNEIMAKLYPDNDLRPILPDYRFDEPKTAVSLNYNGGVYQIMSMPIHRKSTDRELVFQYWIDRTEAEHYKRLYEERMPYVALIYVDNLEELSADQQFHRTTVLLEVERLISELTREMAGVYRKYDTGRFILIFDAKQLDRLKAERFPLLDAAHKINTGTTTTVSLSIAIGESETISKSEESAREAMELVLGRGGDQAVVKNGTNYSYFGGKRQLDSTQSRVKSRQFAKALRQMFENSGDIVIMGHRNPDMDCLGPALGLVVCARMIGSRAFVVLDEVNDAIEYAVEQLRTTNAYADCLITSDQAEKLLRNQSILIVVDTQRPSQTQAPQLLNLASRIVVIDHHRRGAEHIENDTLNYLSSRASSASEIVTEIMQYFDDNTKPPSLVSSALLAGITLDTKHFAFNVGSRTFEAAGYLRRYGADLSMVKQIFQDDMESYLSTAKTVSTAEYVIEGVAMAVVEEGTQYSNLIAAKASDQLVGIRGIEASFVIGRQGGVLYVSGRSLGRFNVQIICEKLGGGGHLLIAGAQLYDVDSMEEAKARVRKAILEYDAELKAAE